MRIQELNAYLQQHQEPQQLLNPNQTKQHLSGKDSANTYSQPNSSKTPPSSHLFTRDSFEQPISFGQPFANQSTINNLRLSDATNISSSINNPLASVSVGTPLYSSTGTSAKLHPISEYGHKVSLVFFNL